MAIFINGMTKQETTDLTIAMAHSGEILNLSTLGEIIVDKHSTGRSWRQSFSYFITNSKLPWCYGC